jgi:hypothetical protein
MAQKTCANLWHHHAGTALLLLQRWLGGAPLWRLCLRFRCRVHGSASARCAPHWYRQERAQKFSKEGTDGGKFILEAES